MNHRTDIPGYIPPGFTAKALVHNNFLRQLRWSARRLAPTRAEGLIRAISKALFTFFWLDESDLYTYDDYRHACDAVQYEMEKLDPEVRKTLGLADEEEQE